MKNLLLVLALLAPAPLRAELDRSAPVPPAAERPFAMPGLASGRTSNGIVLGATEIKNLPIVAVRILIPAASAARASLLFPETEGLAGMAASLLDENTALRDGKAFSLALERLGASFSVSAGADGLTASIFAMKDSLDGALALAAEALLKPAFREEDVDRSREQMISSLREEQGSPQALASRRLSSRVYGGHPYAAGATEASLRAINAPTLAFYHSQAYRPEGATIQSAGDLSGAELKALAEKHFGSWAAAGVPSDSARAIPQVPTPDALPAAEPAVIDLIDLGDSPQSMIMVGQAALPRRHPDYYPLRVLNAVLGGASGRLDLNLRESKSWSYGVYSTLGSARHGGMLWVQAPVQTDKTAESLSEILAEVRRLRDEDVSPDELSKAKKVLVGSSLRALETIQSIAATRADAELHGLGPDAVAESRDAVMAVTASDLRRVARAYLRPDDAAVVVAGDAAKVKDALSRLRPVRVLEPDGTVRPAPAG